MQFTVPKFLEREAHIIGPLGFRQLIYLGGITLVLVFIWFLASHLVFFLSFVLIGGGGAALLLIKKDGVRLIEIVPKYFTFLSTTKTYVWQKKERIAPIQVVEKHNQKKEVQEAAPLKLAPESKLRKLSSELNLGMK